MEEEMEEDSIECTFTAIEIDLDYEFDAARFFDFCREETVAQACEAELWFQSAPNYPPSPFVARILLGGSNLLETVSTSPKPKGVDITASADSASHIDVEMESYVIDVNNRGLTCYDPMSKDNSKAKIKTVLKPSIPRSSTLMKPTASQLAKQNQPHPGVHLRSQKWSYRNNDKSSNNSCATELQAAKRQKLEGGHLRKHYFACRATDTKQQTILVHKPPKKDGTIEGNSMHSKLRVTIPREPALETAHRAQRNRPNASQEIERVTSNIPKFKARPLNRKILEGPSLSLRKRTTPRLPEFHEFHLRTSERAMQHSSAVSSSSTNCQYSDKALYKPSANLIVGRGDMRANHMAAPTQQECESVHNFRARPLNKKEFNFNTDRGVQHDLPIELFNKLSLTSQHQLKAESQLKLPRPMSILQKGSKENTLSSFQQDCEMKHLAKGKQPKWELKQFERGTDSGNSEIGPLSCIPRNFGIR